MAIIIKGSFNDVRAQQIAEQQQAAAPAAPTPVFENRPVRTAPTQQEQTNQLKYVRSEPRQYRNPDKNLLIVDGKEKVIGRQSKYLVDMLTIEE